MTIVLLITTNEQTIEVPVLSKCTIGRSSRCDFTVDDRQMSGQHGTFEINNKGQLVYTDLDSTNGSFLGGSRITKIQLKLNETLRLGDSDIIIDEKRVNDSEKKAIGRTTLAGGHVLDMKARPIDLKPHPLAQEKKEEIIIEVSNSDKTLQPVNTEPIQKAPKGQDRPQPLVKEIDEKTSSGGDGTQRFDLEANEKVIPVKSVILKKDYKKKVEPQGWTGGKNDNVIEQEESSGKTKMLKLDIGKGKKK